MPKHLQQQRQIRPQHAGGRRKLIYANNNTKSSSTFKSSSTKYFLGLVILLCMLLICQLLMIRSTVLTNSNQIRTIDSSSSSSSSSSKKSELKSVHQVASQQQQQQQQHHHHQQQPLSSFSSSSKSNSQSSNNFLYENPIVLDQYPKWIQDYVTWHQQQRTKYPGMELFTNPDAPNVLVRTCLGLCGGLHDRLGQLPWDIYLANATNRVLLLAWQRPRSLEHFLVPANQHIFDWTVPSEAKFGFDDIRLVRNHTNLFEGYAEDRPTQEFWDTDLDVAIQRANTGIFKDIKILRHRILGHLGEDDLERRLSTAGYDDAIHSEPLFGNIFWLFFKPSLEVHNEVTKIMDQLHLSINKYSAVHCRVRHPKAFEYGDLVKGKNPKYPADKTGLPWEGQTRQFALEVATQAIQCSRDISASSEKQNYPIYFLSDSNDLVRHVSIELIDDKFVEANRTEIDLNLLQVVRGGNSDGGGPPTSSSSSSSGAILARDVREETAHLDKQKGRPPPAYYSTFIDLILTMHASCVVYGVGYYSAFAAKISGTNCSYTYAQEAWGAQAEKNAHFCPRHPHAKNANS